MTARNVRCGCLATALSLVLLAAATPGRAAAGTASAPAAAPTRAPAATARPPANVDVYATTDIGGGQQCLAGAAADRDGMHERPVVYLARAGGGFLWHTQLPIPPDYYQGRATHCAVRHDAVYVLVQMDTDSQQSTSQTLLRVVELDRRRGTLLASRDLAVPGVSSAYSAWVDEDGGHFGFAGGKLVISGTYELMSERDNPSGGAPTSFTVALAADLRP